MDYGEKQRVVFKSYTFKTTILKSWFFYHIFKRTMLFIIKFVIKTNTE